MVTDQQHKITPRNYGNEPFLMILIEIMLTGIKYLFYEWRGYFGAYMELVLIYTRFKWFNVAHGNMLTSDVTEY